MNNNQLNDLLEHWSIEEMPCPRDRRCFGTAELRCAIAPFASPSTSFAHV